MESENESDSQGQNTDSSVVDRIQEEEEIITFEADKVFSKKLDRNRSLIWKYKEIQISDTFICFLLFVYMVW